jgi:SAM-dependent methyltransferase
MKFLKALDRAGVFDGGRAAVLDIGASNLYYARPEEVLEFFRKYGKRPLDDWLLARAARLARRSHPGPGYALSYVSEVFAETTIRYQALDIFEAPATRILDLNFEHLPRALTGRFDLVLNFGTTEHLFGQYNAFRVMHDALKVGGYFYHQVPTTGFLNQGYFTYHPRVFGDLAAANGYRIVELFYSGDGHGVIGEGYDPPPNLADAARFRATARELGGANAVIPNGLLNALMRKERAGPFRLGLETMSTLGAPAPRIARAYGLPLPPTSLPRRVLKKLGVGHALRALGLRRPGRTGPRAETPVVPGVS